MSKYHDDALQDVEFQRAIKPFTEAMRAPLYASLLTAGFENGLFEEIMSSAPTLDELAGKMQWDREILEEICRAYQAFDIFMIKSGRLSLSNEITALLRHRDVVDSILLNWSMVNRETKDIWHVLRTGDHRGTALSSHWSYKAVDDVSNFQEINYLQVDSYSNDMKSTMALHAANFLQAVDVSSWASVLDLGGGYGEFAKHLLESNPDIDVTVFDLPQIEKGFREHTAGLANAPGFAQGSFFDGGFPAGFGVITLNRILWDWKDAQALTIATNAYASQSSGGKIFVYEAMYTGDPENDAKRAATALQHVLFGGKIRSTQVVIDLLMAAGYRDAVICTTDLSGYVAIGAVKQ